MRRFYLAVSIVLTLAAAHCVKAETVAEKPQKFDLKTSLYSCKILPSGGLRAISLDGVPIVEDMIIFGRADVAGKNERIYQSKKAGEWKLEKKGKKHVFLASGQLVAGKEKENVAEFKQKISFYPDKIVFKYEVETTAVMSMKKWLPFSSLYYVSFKHVLGKALEVTEKNSDTSIHEIPETYSKEKVTWPRNMIQACFNLNKGTMTVSLPEDSKSWMTIGDTRSWKGRARLETLVRSKPLTGRKATVNCPKGTKFNWAMTIAFSGVNH